MNVQSTTQTLQLVAWLLAVSELVVGLYILFLNIRHIANLLVSGLLVLFAVNSFAVGQLMVAQDLLDVTWQTYILAATSPILGPGLLATTVVLLKPNWFRKNKVWAWLFLALAFVPVLLTLVDMLWDTGIWYTGLDAVSYRGGFVMLSEYAAGWLSWPVIIGLYMIFLPLLPVFLIGYWLIRDKIITAENRQLAIMLLFALILASVPQFAFPKLVAYGIALLIANAVYVLAYSYAGFRQMISERHLQRGRLQTRLTLLILVISVPILTMGVILVGTQAVTFIEKIEARRLETLNRSLALDISVWLDVHTEALYQLVSHPQIISMNSAEQKPLLEAMVTFYPSMYLVSITDLTGQNVVRSDRLAAMNYEDRLWFQEVKQGAPLAYEVVIGRTSREPSLVVAMPIVDEDGQRVAVGMFAVTLNVIAEQIRLGLSGESGYAYVVDRADRVVIHSDPALATSLEDFSTRAPVLALRNGDLGTFRFSDSRGENWLAYVDRLDNGWGVIVQQPESDVLQVGSQFQGIYVLIIVVGILILSLMGSLMMRQAFRPILSLTETARAITHGDLSRVAPVESSDEIGELAQTFNAMTEQLNTVIANLEDRVVERTQALERRAEYLAITGQVSRVAVSILDVDELLDRVTNLISERFDFYHTGIFLVDDSGEWAILRAVSSEEGRRMLARGHRLRVGTQGIVGYVSGSGRPRISLDVDEDTVWVENPDLPVTRSEMALPLSVGDRVIGVLDVQSKAANAFSLEDVETLRILADQIAIAIQNARVFQERQQTLMELQRAYGSAGQQAWAARASMLMGYRYTPAEISVIRDVQNFSVEDVESTQVLEANTLRVPLRLTGGQIFGALSLQRPPEQPWTTQEVRFVRQAVQDVAQALEVARLLEETRMRAARDRLMGEISGQVRTSATDVDMVLQTTLRQLGQVLHATGKIQISAPQQISALTAEAGENHEEQEVS